MRRLAITLCATVCLSLLTGCGSARQESKDTAGTSTQATSSAAAMLTFTHPSMHFSFSYPADLAVVPPSKNHVWYSLCNQSEHLCIEMRIDVARDTNKKNQGLVEWYLQNWGVPAATLEEKKRTEPDVEQVTLDGQPAIRSATASANGIFSLYIVTPVQNKFLFLSVDYNGKDAYSAGIKYTKPLSDEILKTFRR